MQQSGFEVRHPRATNPYPERMIDSGLSIEELHSGCLQSVIERDWGVS
jgi:hypothetical protein